MKKVLIIEDEPEMRRNLLTILRLEKFEPLGAENGRTGVRLAKTEKPDLVLCDVMMPEMPGADLHAEVVRVDPALARSIVFMTGGAFSAREQEFLARIPNVCLEKPLELPRLRALVRAAR